MGRALRGTCFPLLAVGLLMLAGCGSTSTHRLPAYETPIARTEYQTVRTTAYTDTEADHLAYTNHNALGGILHDAGPPLVPGTRIVTTGGRLPNGFDGSVVEYTGSGFRPVSNDAPVVRSANPLRTPSASRSVAAAQPADVPKPARATPPTTTRPASAEPDDNPPWMKEYLRRKQQQQQGSSRAVYYEVSDVALAVGSAAADWSRWPVGTVFEIESTGQTYKVDDYGWALAGRNTIDLYKSSRAGMNAWGVRRVPIRILKWGSREESLRLLRNHQGYKHIRRMVLELEGHDQKAAELQ